MQTSSRRRDELDDLKFDRLISLKHTHDSHNRESKSRALALTRRVPMQVLAQEWFGKISNENTATATTRAYLVEHLLPVLVLGCERVLAEAHRRALVDA